MSKIELYSNGEHETAAFAKIVGPSLKTGDLIILEGDLGSGKTYFVKEIVHALGSSDSVTSPTFSLANFYKGKHLNILHIDAFRLENELEFLDLGIFEYFSEHVTFMEWGEKFSKLFSDFLKIQFDFHETHDDARYLEISIHGFINNLDLKKLEARLQKYRI